MSQVINNVRDISELRKELDILKGYTPPPEIYTLTEVVRSVFGSTDGTTSLFTFTGADNVNLDNCTKFIRKSDGRLMPLPEGHYRLKITQVGQSYTFNNPAALNNALKGVIIVHEFFVNTTEDVDNDPIIEREANYLGFRIFDYGVGAKKATTVKTHQIPNIINGAWGFHWSFTGAQDTTAISMSVNIEVTRIGSL